MSAGSRYKMEYGRKRQGDRHYFYFIERLWRSVQYEEVYLYGYSDGKHACSGLKNYFSYYNGERKHENLGYEIPSEVYEMYAKKHYDAVSCLTHSNTTRKNL